MEDLSHPSANQRFTLLYCFHPPAASLSIESFFAITATVVYVFYTFTMPSEGTEKKQRVESSYLFPFFHFNSIYGLLIQVSYTISLR
jgi:hypothetical protein